MKIASTITIGAALCGLSVPALADDDHEAPSLPSQVEAPPPDRDQLFDQQMAELKERLTRSEDAQNKKSPLSLHGYADLGFFVPYGNGGAGWIRDAGHTQMPAYNKYAWTFLGDILATTINSRGEVADLGDAPGVDRFDSVDSNGAPGFLVNEINLRLGFELTEQAILRTSIDFMPRTGHEFSIGDFMEVDVAELEYVLTRDGNTSIFVGKSLPTFGIEYKERKSDQRFGITPSLVQRYTSGSQIGLKIRSKLLNDWLILAGSVTNGSSVTEQFHFSREIDDNAGKTFSGRGAISLPIGDLARFISGDRLELGASGEWGPQDNARNNGGDIRFFGVDVQYLGTGFAIKAQAMRGDAPGRELDGTFGLKLNKSGYVELDWQVLARLGLLLRAEARDAVVTLGTERAYITKSARFTGGLRLQVAANVVVKAEYLNNRELGGIHEFKNDIFTSSLVLGY
jgi:hypothetical protein